MKPEQYRKILSILKEKGVFEAVSGILAGKPMDEMYMDEYRQALIEVIDDPHLPVVYNLNIGHSQPRCILPLGVRAAVNTDEQVIRFPGSQRSV